MQQTAGRSAAPGLVVAYMDRLFMNLSHVLLPTHSGPGALGGQLLPGSQH
jgi:hypothetical protein